MTTSDLSTRAPRDLPAAVLWDMDGTLVASEPYWMEAERELVESYGLTWTSEDALAMVGMPLVAAGEVMAAHGVPLPAQEIADRLVAVVAEHLEREVPWQPGALRLLTELHAAGVPCALVTMSYRVLAEKIVHAVPGGGFATMVCGDDVTHGKPHPEPYLMAAARLGVDPARCIAVEDSLPGLSSALDAGTKTIGVEVMVPIPVVPKLSRVGSLDDLTLDDLARIASGEVLDLLGSA
ncbi:MAG: HAD family phosphatase [Actinomycetota bacterium]|nr:HAD family phosphatase [Actinomycetota bacterium]